MEPEFVEPTAVSRRKVLGFFILGIVVAGVLIFVVSPMFFGFVDSLPICQRLHWLRGLLFSLLATMPLAGIWGIWYARKVFQCGRWPLPNATVWRRARVHRGIAAKVPAYALLLASCMAISIPLFAWQWLGQSGLLSQPAQCAPNPSIER
jgi:hypothetical protein